MAKLSGGYKAVRPSYEDDGEDNDNDYLETILSRNEDGNDDNDDEYSSLSFGSLNNAQKQLQSSKHKGKRTSKRNDSGSESGSDNDSDSDQGPPESSKNYNQPRNYNIKANSRNNYKDKDQDKKKKNKHAPSSSSSKKPVSKIREIPGLTTSKDSTLYTDIRFDPAYGKADLHKSRKNYAFLDDYRKDEIKNMESILRDKKKSNYLSNHDEFELKEKLQSLKSRLDTMKSRDLEYETLEKHRREQAENVREGKQVNQFYLKKSEQRKLIQKAKFDSMKSGQREKVMERKRKRRLGKEFKQLEFRNNQ